MDTVVNATTATQAAEPEKKGIKINIKVPVNFEANALTQYTSTNEFSKIINDIFKQTFEDYVGCVIRVIQTQPNQNGPIISTFYPELFFKVLTPDSYKAPGAHFAFVPVTANPKDDMVQRIRRVSQIASIPNAKIMMSDDGKSVFEDFINAPKNYNRDTLEWKNYFSVTPAETETLIRVYNFDMIKFIKKIYGEYDLDNGSKLMYQVTPIYCRRSGYGNVPDNWNIAIAKANVDNIMKSAELTGIQLPNVGPASMPKYIPVNR